MDFSRVQAFVSDAWESDALPKLQEFIAIPAQSPAFDPQWQENGDLEQALSLLADWAAARLVNVSGACVEIVRLAGKTSSIFVDIPGDERAPVLLYGHYDKQPPMDGWQTGKGAWTPVIEGERLYGRGGADDGYAIFSAVIAALALRSQSASHPPLKILIEGSEESGSGDLEGTIDRLEAKLGKPGLVIALDGSCGNYDQLWAMTSLRGQIAGTLTVRTMCEGVHSGEASGVVAAPFRIARQLLSRIEDPKTGRILDDVFYAQIPAVRLSEAEITGELVGPLHRSMPLSNKTEPVTKSASEQLLNRAWRPQLAIVGFDGLPNVANAAAVAWPSVALRVSIRIPPKVDPGKAAARLKELLEADPPYSCDVSFSNVTMAAGWSAPELTESLFELFDNASRLSFGQPFASLGGGGGIPFLSILGDRFPDVQLLVTGVLGPKSNAHGPNEFLHLPAARKLTSALAYILHNMEDR